MFFLFILIIYFNLFFFQPNLTLHLVVDLLAERRQVPVGRELVRDGVLGVPLAAGELKEVVAKKLFFRFFGIFSIF
jgi:hypothetical protein